MMQIDIHDVGHGHCAVVTTPDGTRLMIDCGSNPSRGWWPSIHYWRQHIDILVLQNLDEDHVDDLADMWRQVTIGAIVTNPTITAQALQRMKADGGMGPGVRFAHTLIGASQPGLVHGQLPLTGAGGVDAFVAWNRHGIDFVDTNNLSMATFVEYGPFVALFTGDLEGPGWRALLKSPGFVAHLSRVTVLIASHHGRKNGCCEEAFNLMRPEIVIFSDDTIQYESQDTIGWYRQRTQGIPDLTKPFNALAGYPRRRVFTTRRDGSIAINVAAGGKYVVTSERDTGTHFLPAPVGLGLNYLSAGLGNSNAVGLGPASNWYLGRN
jgi:beta-lactamase superfamily II metal-dependent hydrolase